MLKRLLNLVLIYCFFYSISWAAVPVPEQNTPAITRVQVLSQQTDLLKNRLTQASNELIELQHPRDEGQASKQLLQQIGLDMDVARSNIDSINIELSESQQT